MHLEDHIKDLLSRRESIDGLIHMANSISCPPEILNMLDARRSEIVYSLESAEDVNGQPRENRDMSDVQCIHSVAALEQLRQDLGCRPDWHEPDEQDVNAYLQGAHLDNAMGACADPERACGEFNVVITREDKPVAVVNLAYLLAWACAGASDPAIDPGDDIPF